MGEYVNYKGNQVKIGTCEDLFYTSAVKFINCLPEMGKADNNITPRSYLNPKNGYRFRFPFPDEDKNQFGEVADFNRGMLLTAPRTDKNAELFDIDHAKISMQQNLTSGGHMIISSECPLSKDFDRSKIRYTALPAHSVYLELVAQKIMPVEGEPGAFCLWPVLRCPACGQMVRVDRDEFIKMAEAVDQDNETIKESIRRALVGYDPIHI